MPDIPGYRIVREIGRGGMATVFLAIQEKFDRQVAVKVMDSELLHDETFSKRFRREAQIVAKLNHPHIIQVYDVGLAVNRHYLVMELVTGGELNDRLEQGLDVGTAFRVTKEIARPRFCARPELHPPRHQAGEHSVPGGWLIRAFRFRHRPGHG